MRGCLVGLRCTGSDMRGESSSVLHGLCSKSEIVFGFSMNWLDHGSLAPRAARAGMLLLLLPHVRTYQAGQLLLPLHRCMPTADTDCKVSLYAQCLPLLTC